MAIRLWLNRQFRSLFSDKEFGIYRVHYKCVFVPELNKRCGIIVSMLVLLATK